MDTDELLESAYHWLQYNDDPNGAMALALIAIANELKRQNDLRECADERNDLLRRP